MGEKKQSLQGTWLQTVAKHESMIVINCLKTRENKKQGLKGYHKETRDVKIIQYKNILLPHFKEIKIKVDFINTPFH